MAKVTLPPITVRGVPLFDCAYAPHEEKYYIREGDRWTPYSEKNMKLRLRLEGLSTRTQQGANVSPVDAALHDVQTLRQVEHAAPLAGWESGLVEIAGKLILITESAKVLAAKDVPCPNLLKYLEELLGAEPLRHQLGWWRWARRNVGNKQMLPGQCCVYVGAAGVGKSLCQRLTSRLLCSRDASAYDYMSGRSTFNLELFAAEFLRDENLAQRSKKFASTTFKNVTANINKELLCGQNGDSQSA